MASRSEEAAREATEADVGRLSELRLVAATELATERGAGVYLAREGRREPPDISLKGALADRRARVWAGTIDDYIVGYLVARVEDLADGRRLGLVEDIFVEAGAREVGIGEVMMDEALAWFRSEGCIGADAAALPGMRATKNFFETFGFTARLLIVHHRFDDKDAGGDGAT
ncbi:MAG: hypothetical protein QOE80_3709 [Actinomycetota bacterium]|nr:hypothetical protein [Actinomycetota bacterium]